jgi:hypothetical protein
MTEAEWLTCSDPEPMLEYLRGKASDRKLQLFAVACCRRIWNSFTDERSQQAVEISELYADGSITAEEMAAAQNIAEAAARAAGSAETEAKHVAWAAVAAAMTEMAIDVRAWQSVRYAAWASWAIWASARAKTVVRERRLESARAVRTATTKLKRTAMAGTAARFRDVFGNPFRPVPLDLSWLVWNDGTVPKLAQVIYDERRFEDLPVLADALEDASCTDTVILSHCRAPGEHVRGCWVIDLLLGKS